MRFPPVLLPFVLAACFPEPLVAAEQPLLVGYVSDEDYVALPGVFVEFERDGRSIAATSRATGSIYAPLEAGTWSVTLSAPGYGAKRVELEVSKDHAPHQFRLLSDELTGYVWPKWVKSGEESEVRFHAAEDYVVELWRYGWKKEQVKTVGVFGEHGPRARVQITPDGDYTQTGVKWNRVGYDGRARIKTVRAPGRSGLYYLHARTKSGAFFSTPWIVAPKEPTAKIAVLASNLTWNAYNNFGGRGNYIQGGGLRDRPTVNARQELDRYTDTTRIFYDSDEYPPVSFDRPAPLCHVDEDEEITDPIQGRNACHTAPAEWRLLGWMDREGFAYDLYAETQFHLDAFDLRDYRVLVLSTHPEYWSAHMYEELKKWVFEGGGKLLYLGGNGLCCEVRFVDESRVQYLNTNFRKHAPGEAFDSRFHRTHESPANLLGVVFTGSGAMTGAPFRVLDASHWIYEGTGLKDGDLFGEKSLHVRCPGGASGHETDKLSPFAPKTAVRLAKGTNPNDGGAEIVYFETAGGGAVFSTGSIAWSSSIPVDDDVSRVTANVLRRFLE